MLGAVLALAAVAGTALAADHAVGISGFNFSPASVTVTVGDTVTWTNSDDVPHTATADGGAFDTGTIGGNSSKAVTLTTAGTFVYHCTIHPAMTATLVVTAAGAPPATDTETSETAGSGLPWASLLLGVTMGVWVVIGRRRSSGRRHFANQSPQDS